MVSKSVFRKELGKLTAAALGGVMAGSMVTSLTGCGSNPTNSAAVDIGAQTVSMAKESEQSNEQHACAGLNGCKGKGADGKNSCAGTGGCASKAMHHECKGHNACKGQGGCESKVGENACKGQGGCAVPMKDMAAWKMAREKFESKMQADGKEVGPAPSKS